MTRLRKTMLEELQRRNYSQTTVKAYLSTVEAFATDDLGSHTGTPHATSSVDRAKDPSGCDTAGARPVVDRTLTAPPANERSRPSLPTPSTCGESPRRVGTSARLRETFALRWRPWDSRPSEHARTPPCGTPAGNGRRLHWLGKRPEPSQPWRPPRD